MTADWWPPIDATERLWATIPPVGSILAIDYRAVEVIAHDTRPNGRITLRLKRLYGPKVKNENNRAEFGWTPSGERILWLTYPGRIPLCSCCGHPWPCQIEMDQRQATSDMEHLAGQIAKAADGICYACGEVITTRQASVLAPEPNVELAGFSAPAFHLRWKCRGGLEAYEARRRRALADEWTPLIGAAEQLDMRGRTWDRWNRTT